MSSAATFHESRRSTRVPLKVVIAVEGNGGTQTCDGETIVINLHGALISTTEGLSAGIRISIHVYVTDKRAAGRVVYVDPTNPVRCGIGLQSGQRATSPEPLSVTISSSPPGTSPSVHVPQPRFSSFLPLRLSPYAWASAHALSPLPIAFAAQD